MTTKQKTINFILGAVLVVAISYNFRPSNAANIVSMETSNGSIVTNADDTWTASVTSAGGYARINYKAPEMDKKVITSFNISATFVLPNNFYTNLRNGFRILTTDNYPAVIDGIRVGAKDLGGVEFNEWRCGVFFWAGDKLLHLRCEHETKGSFELWKSAKPLAVGAHTVQFSGDMTRAARWEFVLDGVVVASGEKQLCLPELLISECVITRVRAGIDGGGAGATVILKEFGVSEIGGVATVPATAISPTAVPATKTPLAVPTRCEFSASYMICTR